MEANELKKNLKRAISVLLVAAVLLCAAPPNGLIYSDLFDFSASAVEETETTISGEYGENLTWSIDKTTKVLSVVCDGQMPYFENTQTPWFGYKKFFRHVYINEGCESLSKGCFRGCDNIVSADIPASISQIDSYVFEGCTGLEKIILPENATEIGEGMFSNCTGLKNIEIPESVKSIYGYAFSGCTGLTNVVIPDTVMYISGGTFLGCTNLKSVVLPENITYIPSNIFKNCTSLESFDINDGVTNIGYEAFYNCRSLASVDIPDSVTNINYNAFYGCTSLATLEVPDSVIFLESSAFDYSTQIICSENSDAHLYAVKNSYAYWLNDSMNQEQTISGKVGTKLTWSIDRKTRKLTVNNNGVMISFASGDAPWLEYNEYVVTAEISDGCTNISHSSFDGCMRLESVIIPDSVKTIDEHAFSSCYRLTDIKIPDGVTSIGSYAFSNCSDLENIIIPDNVTHIYSYAFYYCTNLKSIVFPESVKYLEHGAFENCSNLSSVTFGNGIEGIGSYAFENCRSLSEVRIPESCRYIGSYAFSDCPNVSKIYFYNKDCDIYEASISVYSVIYGYKGSTAEIYAKKNGYEFVPIDIPCTGHYYDNSCDASCNVCEVTREISHSYGEWIVEYAPSCIGNGVKARTCSVCGKTEKADVVGAGDHIFSNPCDTSCNICDFKRETTHEYGEWVVIAEPSCTYVGYKRRVCSICSSYDKAEIETSGKHVYYSDCSDYCSHCGEYRAAPHNFGEWVIENEPTCYYTGKKYRCCEDCGQTIYEYIEPTGKHEYDNECDDSCNICGSYRDWAHEFGEWKVTSEATCSREGVREHTCSLCGYSESEYTAKISHTDKDEDGICEVCKRQFAIKYPMHGVCGPDLTWTLDEEGVLRIKGKGEMYDFTTDNEIVIDGSGDNVVIPTTERPKTTKRTTTKRTTTTRVPESPAYTNPTGVPTTTRPESTTHPEYTTRPESTTHPEYTTRPETTTVPATIRPYAVDSAYVTTEGSTRTTNNYRTTTRIIRPSTTTKAYYTTMAPETTRVYTTTKPYQSTTVPSSESYPEVIRIIRWNLHFDKIKKVIIEDGVTSIGVNAFNQCRNLESVQIPDTVNRINLYAFRGCSSLETFTTPSGYCDIYDNAFEECGSLTTLNFNITDGYISNSAFPENSIKTMNVGTDVNVLPNIRTLVNVNFADGAKIVPDMAFSDCKNLKNVKLADSIEYIGSRAFDKCSGLDSIELPDCLTSIGERAFYSCKNLKEVDLPDSLETIGTSAFANCTSLREIIIPDSVTYIDAYAFNGCKSVASLTISESVETIEYGAFAALLMLEKIDFNAVNANSDEYNYYGDIFANSGTGANGIDVVFGEKVKAVPAYLFEVGSETAYPNIKNIVIGSNVRKIGESAFRNCCSVETVKFGKNVEIIGARAFENCFNIESLNLPESLKQISDFTFARCTGIKELNIPENVAYIGIKAFSGCCFEIINYNAANCIIDYTDFSFAFENCENVRTIYIGNEVNTVPAYAFSGCVNLEKIYFPDVVINIHPLALSGCGYVAIVCKNGSYANVYAVENNIRYILEDNEKGTAFEIKNNILISYDGSAANVVLPSDVIFVGTDAFNGNSTVESIEIPYRVSKIYQNAFANCSNLESVIIPYTVTDISDLAFSGTDATIYCYYNSYAYNYAVRNNIKYEHITVNLSSDSISMSVGETVELYAVPNVTLACGIPMAWKSSDPDVASVDSKGTVSAKKPGKTKVGVYAPDGSVYDECLVEVTGSTTDCDFDISFEEVSRNVLKHGEKIIFHINTSDLPAGATLKWATSDGKIFKLSNENADCGKHNNCLTCTVESVGKGSAKITATVIDGNGNPILVDGEEVTASYTMTSKSNFFLKFIAFFKKLFKTTKTYPQKF